MYNFKIFTGNGSQQQQCRKVKKAQYHVPVRRQGRRYGYNRGHYMLIITAYGYRGVIINYISAQDSGEDESWVPFVLLMVLRLMLLSTATLVI
jgi:hypothetical protein